MDLAAPPSHPQRRAFSVQVVRGSETFDELVDSLPEVYRQREAAASTRRFSHLGAQAAEVEVRFPSSVQQMPTFLGVFIEGNAGVIVTCGGERDESVEGFCRTVIDSLWMGPNARATPPGRAPSGTRWFGGRAATCRSPKGGRRSRGCPPRRATRSAPGRGRAPRGGAHFINDLQIRRSRALQGRCEASPETAPTPSCASSPTSTGAAWGCSSTPPARRCAPPRRRSSSG
ncbi:MAG: hypothetical protein IPN17_36765 [Deltaproteobacteria bacterium]|nr:hypothetical protein [Deltaproteobacteria bacterium]